MANIPLLLSLVMLDTSATTTTSSRGHHQFWLLLHQGLEPCSKSSHKNLGIQASKISISTTHGLLSTTFIFSITSCRGCGCCC
jgi:hypothetical protein